MNTNETWADEFDKTFLETEKGYTGEGDMEEIDYLYFKHSGSYWDFKVKEVEDIKSFIRGLLSKERREMEEEVQDIKNQHGYEDGGCTHTVYEVLDEVLALYKNKDK